MIVFVVSHNDAYGFEYLIKAIRKLETDRVCAVFVGNGYLKEQLMEETKAERDKYIFLPPIRKGTIPTLFRQADALCVSDTKDNLFRFGISVNKLMDSMMARRPILYAVNVPNNYIEKYNCGVSDPPRDEKMIACGIEKLIGMPESQRNQTGTNGQKATMENFGYKIISKGFLKIIKEIS